MSDPKDREKLLPILNEKHFQNAELREVIKDLYFQVVQSQVIELELRNSIEKMNLKVGRMHDALSSVMYLRSGFVTLKYINRTSEIRVGDHFYIDFSNTIENDLLQTMFVRKTGKQRTTKWQTMEIAKEFKYKGNDQLDTSRKVYRVANRIKDKLHKEIGFDVLYVKGKEYYWYL